MKSTRKSMGGTEQNKNQKKQIKFFKKMQIQKNYKTS
jgi:hypothetical protein